MGKEGMYSRAFPPILKLRRGLVNSGCPSSPPSVHTILWPSLISVFLWFSFLLLYECFMAQANLTLPNAGETERCTTWPCPHEAHRTIRVREDRDCGCWVPSSCYKLELGPGSKEEEAPLAKSLGEVSGGHGTSALP